MDTAILTIRAARRLMTISTIVLTVYSVLSVLSAGLFTAALIRSDNKNDRIYSGVGIGSTIASWLFVALLCFAADAVGRHIEHQAE